MRLFNFEQNQYLRQYKDRCGGESTITLFNRNNEEVSKLDIFSIEDIIDFFSGHFMNLESIMGIFKQENVKILDEYHNAVNDSIDADEFDNEYSFLFNYFHKLLYDLRDRITGIFINHYLINNEYMLKRFNKMDIDDRYQFMCNEYNLCNRDLLYKYVQKEYSAKNYKNYLKTLYWKTITKYVKNQSNYACGSCGEIKSEWELNVHHKDHKNYKSKGKEMMSTTAMLTCFCNECHGKIHKMINVKDLLDGRPTEDFV